MSIYIRIWSIISRSNKHELFSYWVLLRRKEIMSTTVRQHCCSKVSGELGFLKEAGKASGLTAAHVISIEMLFIQNVYFPSHLRRSSLGWIHCFEHAKRLFQDSNHSDEVTWKMMASENKYGQKSPFMNDVFNGEGQCVGQGINSGNKRMFEDIWSQDNISESIWPFKHPTASVL